MLRLSENTKVYVAAIHVDFRNYVESSIMCSDYTKNIGFDGFLSL